MRMSKPCKSFPPQVGVGHSVYHSSKQASYSKGHESKMPFCGIESGRLACILLMRNVNPLLLQFLEAVSIFLLMAFSHFQSQQWMAKPLPCPISHTDFFPLSHIKLPVKYFRNAWLVWCFFCKHEVLSFDTQPCVGQLAQNLCTAVVDWNVPRLDVQPL